MIDSAVDGQIRDGVSLCIYHCQHTPLDLLIMFHHYSYMLPFSLMMPSIFFWFSLQFFGEVHRFEQHHELEVGINPGT